MQLKKEDREKLSYEKRTLENLRKDYTDFVKAGSNAKEQASFHNVTNPPIFNIEPAMWCIAFLHLTLGIVLRIHNLLIIACYSLDMAIAQQLAGLNFPTGSSKYDEYISITATILALEEQIDELQETRKELQELSESTSAALSDIRKWDADLNHNKEELKRLEQLRDSLQKSVKVPSKESGPVVCSLDKTLQKHNINRQAYHGKSFVGNHCHKYLQEEVHHDVLNEMVAQCQLLTGDQDILDDAMSVKVKFLEMYRLFSCIYSKVSHSDPISKDEIPAVQKCIDEFMAYYRKEFPESSIPLKCHLLEDHITEWLYRFPFGFGLLGEQGAEAIHSEINRLNRAYRAMPCKEKRLHSTMEEHQLKCAPEIQERMPKRRKYNKSKQKAC